ncbi:AEC family transporter [Lutibaculum baratangense]|uniref:Transporter n=1 Tax=Lutibaculum baratangense AMV1 TaxID=631454 RepID=V4RDC8_9HYPH|nr:AEC family transporter [Lutibaculum baratangense]ESR24161.1 hypothetical protein N177_2610 [Lutibaculum baratangense AMV1]
MLDSIVAIAAIVIPVFGLIGIGFASVKTKLLKMSVGDGLADFVFIVALPVLLFKTLATAELGDVSPWPFLISYFAGVAVVWTASDFTVRRIFGRDARSGVTAGVSGGFSNIALVGLPFSISAFGEAGSVPAATLLAVHLPIMMTVSTLLVQRAERIDGTSEAGVSLGQTLLRVGGNLIRNPLIVGILAGVAWWLTGLPITGIPRRLIDMLTAPAVPCALFALGISLARYGISGNIRPALVIAGLKLVLLPACVYLLVSNLTDLPQIWINVATMAAACPTGVNAWLIASRFGTGLALSANVITMSTAMAVVSMTVWLAILTH